MRRSTREERRTDRCWENGFGQLRGRFGEEKQREESSGTATGLCPKNAGWWSLGASRNEAKRLSTAFGGETAQQRKVGGSNSLEKRSKGEARKLITKNKARWGEEGGDERVFGARMQFGHAQSISERGRERGRM
eukprot:6203322-Pleurochrysis_carterae.AAC.1